jgi:hypothetical protein
LAVVYFSQNPGKHRRVSQMTAEDCKNVGMRVLARSGEIRCEST